MIKIKLFHYRYFEELLEKTLHPLRTGMLREIKKINSGVVIPEKRRFFDDLKFLKSDLNKENKKSALFENDEIKMLIKFYSENLALWNDHLVDYCDRNLLKCWKENSPFQMSCNGCITCWLNAKKKNTVKIPLKNQVLEDLMYIHHWWISSRSCLLLMSLVMPTYLVRPWTHQLLKSKKEDVINKGRGIIYESVVMECTNDPHPWNEFAGHRKTNQVLLEKRAHL